MNNTTLLRDCRKTVWSEKRMLIENRYINQDVIDDENYKDTLVEVADADATYMDVH